ncbi:MAG: chemotaxis protein CheW [Rhodoferax ferrireducens]|uniref:Chemotaxis protein CheW n=1 Tax=Rhodoferax ferrireducens TaxID=192843 RepID=A0A1W9KQQ3_9BURK|nr:MAG: chemotaxis protein CheW [Rhodoferax ferrireducens]
MKTETPEQRADESPPQDDGLVSSTSETRQFVTFMTGGEVFAVDMAPVQEIIRMPDVVRVPMAPATLNGLANLRGKVLPIISLRRMFGFPEQASDDATRAVIIDVGQPLGFVVDRVASVVGVEPSQIEGVGAIRSAVDTDLLSGLIKGVGGHEMIMVLDFAKLIEREFAQMASLQKQAGISSAVAADSDSGEEDALSDELQLVSFNVAEQEYAIAIEDVQEIVQVPETIIHVPHSASHVIGVMTLRNRLLPLVNLRRMFGLAEHTLDEKSRIVVLSLGSASVGVAVDGVSEVLRVAKSCVDAMPALLAKEGDLTEIAEICRLDDGKRLVSIITVSNLFDHSAIKEALTTVNETKAATGQEVADPDDALDDDEQVVVFYLDKEEFGVPIHSVQEIVRVPEQLIHVPKAPAFVEGVINLRGSVLPVIDLRMRLGLPRVARSDRQRIMVFLIADVRTGFIVDQVTEVLKIPKAVIEPSPRLSNIQGNILSRMANMEKQKRMVQLLEPAYLVEGDELESLAKVTA